MHFSLQFSYSFREILALCTSTNNPCQIFHFPTLNYIPSQLRINHKKIIILQLVFFLPLFLSFSPPLSAPFLFYMNPSNHEGTGLSNQCEGARKCEAIITFNQVWMWRIKKAYLAYSSFHHCAQAVWLPFHYIAIKCLSFCHVLWKWAN